jgi:hypothetical protein
MIVYTVHEPEPHAKSIEERADTIVFVKEGFTWWGFLFGPFWLLFNRLWLEFIAALLLFGALVAGLAQFGLRDQGTAFVNLFFMLLIGFEGNDLRRWRLDRKNYTFLASVAGRDFEECERRFFEAWLPYAAGKGGKPAAPAPAEPAEPTTPPSSWPHQGWGGSSVIGTLPGANT